MIASAIDDRRVPKAGSSTPDVVAHKLRALILDGDVGPGERINVRDLERLLGVSHIPIREAMKVLESEGLVQHRPKVGAVATEVSLGELEEVYDLRRIIEPPVARRSVERMSEDHIANLDRTCAELEALEESSNEMTDGHRIRSQPGRPGFPASPQNSPRSWSWLPYLCDTCRAGGLSRKSPSHGGKHLLHHLLQLV